MHALAELKNHTKRHTVERRSRISEIGDRASGVITVNDLQHVINHKSCSDRRENCFNTVMLLYLPEPCGCLAACNGDVVVMLMF